MYEVVWKVWEVDCVDGEVGRERGFGGERGVGEIVEVGVSGECVERFD